MTDNWTLADKIADLDDRALLSKDAAAPLLRHVLRGADELRVMEDRRALKEQERAAHLATAADTEPGRRLEAAREALKIAKEKALKCPEVAEAKAAVREAKAKADALPAAVMARQTTREIRELDEATKQKRRDMVAALFGRKAPVIVESAAMKLLPPE